MLELRLFQLRLKAWTGKNVRSEVSCRKSRYHVLTLIRNFLLLKKLFKSAPTHMHFTSCLSRIAVFLPCRTHCQILCVLYHLCFVFARQPLLPCSTNWTLELFFPSRQFCIKSPTVCHDFAFPLGPMLMLSWDVCLHPFWGCVQWTSSVAGRFAHWWCWC